MALYRKTSMKIYPILLLSFLYIFTFSVITFSQSLHQSLFDEEKIIAKNDFFEANNIRTGDVNKDGREDVIVLSYNSPSVVLYLNRGLDRFLAPIYVDSSPLGGANDAVVLDFDFDGDMDLLVGYQSSVRLFKNNGDQTFEEGLEILRNISSSNLSLSDFDGDGNMDIMSSSNSSRYVNIIKPLGDGEFERTSLKSVHNNDADLYDMDLDGDKDVVLLRSEEDSFVWHENLGDSIDVNYKLKNFGGYLQEIIIDDENEDGIKDLFFRTGSGYSVFRHTSDSTFLFISSSSFTATSKAFTVGNFDDTSRKKVALAKGSFKDNYSIIVRSSLNGSETTTVQLEGEIVDLKGLTSADLDNNGRDDLIGVSGLYGYAFWYKNLGNNTFSERKYISTGLMLPSNTQVVDLHGGGLNQIAVISPGQSRIAFFALNYFGNWIQRDHYAGATHTLGMSMVDVNQDDILDIVYSSFTNGELLVKEGLGGGLFSKKTIHDTVYEPFDVKSKDFNNDGLKDVLLILKQAAYSKLYLNSQSGLSKKGISVQLPSYNIDYFFYDLNQNNLMDIVSIPSRNGLSVLFNEGGESFISGSIPFTDGNISNASSLSFNDVDGDTDTDLLFTDYKGGLYWLNREGESSNKELILEPINTDNTESNTILVDDFDGDNDLDIVIREYGGRNLLYFENSGEGVFLKKAALAGSFSQDIELISSDINNSGYKDIIVTDKEKHKISWFRNVSIITSTEEEFAKISDFELLQNYPNPFNPSTNFVFNLKNPMKIEFSIYDITGRLVKTIQPKLFLKGRNEINFDGSNLPSGVYIYKIKGNENVSYSKFTLIE